VDVVDLSGNRFVHLQTGTPHLEAIGHASAELMVALKNLDVDSDLASERRVHH
jgi:hypothetical protein